MFTESFQPCQCTKNMESLQNSSFSTTLTTTHSEKVKKITKERNKSICFLKSLLRQSLNIKPKKNQRKKKYFLFNVWIIDYMPIKNMLDARTLQEPCTVQQKAVQSPVPGEDWCSQAPIYPGGNPTGKQLGRKGLSGAEPVVYPWQKGKWYPGLH